MARFSSLMLAIALAAGSAHADVTPPDPRSEWILDIDFPKPTPREQVRAALQPINSFIKAQRKDGRWTFLIVGDTPPLLKRVVVVIPFDWSDNAATYAAYLATHERAVAPLHGKVTPHGSPDQAKAAATRALTAIERCATTIGIYVDRPGGITHDEMATQLAPLGYEPDIHFHPENFEKLSPSGRGIYVAAPEPGRGWLFSFTPARVSNPARGWVHLDAILKKVVPALGATVIIPGNPAPKELRRLVRETIDCVHRAGFEPGELAVWRLLP
jgi:hypothetical protein